MSYTTKEAAKIIGVSQKTLYNWISLGAGPAHKKLRGKLIFPTDETLHLAKERMLRNTGVTARQYRCVSQCKTLTNAMNLNC